MCAEMTSKVGVAHKFRTGLAREIVLDSLSTPLPSILDPPLELVE